MIKRLMMIDCENILSKEILDVILNMKNWDIVMVLGYKQHPTWLNKISTHNNIRTIEAPSRGHNAADFVLVSEYTKTILFKKYKSSCIISNDQGFKASVDYMKNLGYVTSQYSKAEFFRYFDKDKKHRLESILEIKRSENHHRLLNSKNISNEERAKLKHVICYLKKNKDIEDGNIKDILTIICGKGKTENIVKELETSQILKKKSRKSNRYELNRQILLSY